MKGFKDDKGRFRPMENSNGIKMKAGKSLQSTGVKMKTRSQATSFDELVIDSISFIRNKARTIDDPVTKNLILELAQNYMNEVIKMREGLSRGKLITKEQTISALASGNRFKYLMETVVEKIDPVLQDDIISAIDDSQNEIRRLQERL